MPLSSKRFVISTSALNSQGFRMLTSGADLEAFKKNPVLLFNHQRPDGNSTNQILPMGHWPAEHIQVEGDEITGIPFFDDKDEFAMKIFNKVEGGHIRMCSAGARPLEISEDKADMLPDQEEPTVTKWSLQEVSICDIGANPDSGSSDVALYDASNKFIKLTDKTILKTLTKKSIMNKKVTTAQEALKKAKKAKDEAVKTAKLAAEKVEIALADDDISDEDKTNLSDENDGVQEMSEDDKDAQIDELKRQLADAQAQLKKMTDDAAEADQQDQEQKALAAAKLAQAQGKITLSQVNDIRDMYLANPKGTQKYLDSIKPQGPVRRQINTEVESDEAGDEARLKTLSAKNWDELFKEAGALDFIKLKAPAVYKAKFKAKFNRDPKN